MLHIIEERYVMVLPESSLWPVKGKLLVLKKNRSRKIIFFLKTFLLETLVSGQFLVNFHQNCWNVNFALVCCRVLVLLWYICLCKLLIVGCWLLVFKYWLLVVRFSCRCLLLVSCFRSCGCRMLVVGCLLLVLVVAHFLNSLFLLCGLFLALFTCFSVR